jgi:hypothetical protein
VICQLIFICGLLNHLSSATVIFQLIFICGLLNHHGFRWPQNSRCLKLTFIASNKSFNS